MNDDAEVLGFIGWTVAVLIATAAITSHISENRWQQRAVDRGLALYCPNDGEWAWQGECQD